MGSKPWAWTDRSPKCLELAGLYEICREQDRMDAAITEHAFTREWMPGRQAVRLGVSWPKPGGLVVDGAHAGHGKAPGSARPAAA